MSILIKGIDMPKDYVLRIEIEPNGTVWEEGRDWIKHKAAAITTNYPRSGRWIELAMKGEYKCSVCGRGSRSENTFQLIPKVYWNYCPNCGAKMEEEE